MTPVGSKHGVSPVIATVVLIAIALVVGVALSGWVFGLFKSYTRADAVTILPSESSCSVSGGCAIVVSNEGDQPIMVVRVLADNQQVSTYTVTPTVGSADVLQPHTQATVSFGLSVVTPTQQNVQVQIGLSNGIILTTLIPLTH
ncbi:MAG: archaellin/type IV pilin N-terminal domain-containing protein [Thermoprotei archaeon]